MKPRRSRGLTMLSVLLIAGCRSYELKSPDGFEAEPVAVSGKLSDLAIGAYRLADVRRGWTKGSGTEIMSVKSEKRRQRYEFRVAAAQATTDVRCEFDARESGVGLKSGWEIVTGEGATLNCELTQGDVKSQLALVTEGDAVLSGTLKGPRTYRVEGVGSALFAKGKKGPAAGFYIYDGERVVVVTQIISPRRVLFARATGEAQRAELVPALAALLLLDESIREF